MSHKAGRELSIYGFLAAHVDHVGHEACCWPVALAGQVTGLPPIVGQHGVDLARRASMSASKKAVAVCRLAFSSSLAKANFKIRSGWSAQAPSRSNDQLQLAFLGADFGDVDVEARPVAPLIRAASRADGIGLEAFLRGLVAVHRRQPADAVALQSAMQAVACQAIAALDALG